MQIHVFSGNGMRAVLAELAPQFERASGHTLQVSYDPAQIVLRRVESGEAADVALLGEEAIDRLIERGHVTASSRRLLARNGIGLAVRKHVLMRRGIIASDAQRKPWPALSATAREEVDYLLRRIARRDRRAAFGGPD